jgi:hypothetical protein
MGPAMRPSVVELFHTRIIHIRSVLAYMSWMLPAMTTDGTEEANPDMNRPANTPSMEGATPATTLPMLNAIQE